MIKCYIMIGLAIIGIKSLYVAIITLLYKDKVVLSKYGLLCYFVEFVFDLLIWPITTAVSIRQLYKTFIKKDHSFELELEERGFWNEEG